MQTEGANSSKIQELMEKIANEQEEITKLMSMIDEEQAQIDDLTYENTQLKLNHSQTVNRLAASQLLNRTININTIPRPDEPNIQPKIEESIFNEEHRDLLNEMRNKITHTNKLYNKQKDINDNLEANIDELIEKNSELETETEAYKMKYSNMIRKKRALVNQNEESQKMIRKIDSKIQKTSQLIKEKDQEYARLTELKTQLESMDGSVLSYENETTNIQNQLDEIETSIVNLDAAIQNIEEEDTKTSNNAETKVTQIEKKIGWTQEKKSICEEMDSIKKEYDQIKNDNNHSTSKLSKLNIRYHRLKSLDRKWSSNDIDNLEFDLDLYKDLSIDQLLDRASKEETKQKQESKFTDRTSVEYLESQISQLQHELDRSMFSFHAKVQLTKEEISKRRSGSFDVESVYVRKIYDAQLKAATKNSNK